MTGNILRGECDKCGPSQFGLDPLPAPQKIDDKVSLLVERPTSTAKAILPATDVAGPPPVQQLSSSQEPAVCVQSEEEVKISEIIKFLKTGRPYVIAIYAAPNEMKIIPGNGADGIIVSGMLRQMEKHF